MADLFAWCTFKEIIDDLMLGKGDAADPGQYMRYLNFAVNVYTRLRVHVIPAIESVELPISHEIRAVVMPNDMLKFNSIGILHHGKFHAFKPKESIDFVEMECGEDERDTGQHNEKQHRHHVHGFYTLDRENKRILIDAPLHIQKVILNFTPTGISTDGLTYIPKMYKNYIIAGVEWQESIRDKSLTAYDKQTFEREYIKELNMVTGLQYDTDAIFDMYYNDLRHNLKY